MLFVFMDRNVILQGGGDFMKEVVILDGLRTPIGKYKGQLKDFTAV